MLEEEVEEEEAATRKTVVTPCKCKTAAVNSGGLGAAAAETAAVSQPENISSVKQEQQTEQKAFLNSWLALATAS